MQGSDEFPPGLGALLCPLFGLTSLLCNFPHFGGTIPLGPLTLHDFLLPTVSRQVLRVFSDWSYFCHTAVPEQITLTKKAEFIDRYS